MNRTARNFCFKAIAYLKVEGAVGEGAAVRLHADDSPVLRRLGNRFLVAYLVDEGDHFSYVQGHHLRGAGLSADELHMQALSNLAAFGEESISVQEYGNIYTSMGGTFEASMLLCEDFWEIWYAHLAPNGFIATVPARGVLAFGDSDAQQTVAELSALYELGRPWQDHPLSSSLFRRVGKRWEPLGDSRGCGTVLLH